ncbi:3-deoxy-manno-octulosonate cytidylyltransferase (CMP-KDO synthetase) [Sphingobacterium alimentarium]|uniref:3-deoxy-manno-octulosonate cytidylyltransferase n=1 Tax=Sphingobacterium alimentarium TaxID=797292 RepID=A0A4R3VSJ1_9SPHI|nr:3-deoxy-manno-octulosonate cytidylyltransferase [Sphingobacterium alimentarium]TCV12556.1 3-deoxy-manno-octulosonate cytidylyltransferase (CMP-KDO synthetase) [Sphingobacterium alimentarium]
MKIIGIIPARYDSSRFPGKPLADIAGQSMIQRVYHQAKHATSLSEVIVATDDQRIYDHVKSFAGNVMMTNKEHQSGTDRCAEVAATLVGFDVAINIQGDEPFIDPQQIDLLASCFQQADTEIATLIRRVESEDELFNENKPKVVLNRKGEAIYFSRQAVPFLRGQKSNQWLNHRPYYNHIGIYGYRLDILKQLTALPLSDLETMESLEQLRWIDNGYKIQTAVSTHSNDAIDTPEDLQYVLDKYFNL